MWKSFGCALKRFARATLALVITGALAKATDEPKWLLFAPVIQAVAKYIRQRFGLTNVPL